jgi:hypothetical protein
MTQAKPSAELKSIDVNAIRGRIASVLFVQPYSSAARVLKLLRELAEDCQTLLDNAEHAALNESNPFIEDEGRCVPFKVTDCLVRWYDVTNGREEKSVLICEIMNAPIPRIGETLRMDLGPDQPPKWTVTNVEHWYDLDRHDVDSPGYAVDVEVVRA